MARIGRVKFNGKSWEFDLPNVIGQRPITSTGNKRHLGLTDNPCVVAARFYFEDFERLLQVEEPDSLSISALGKALRFIASLEDGTPLKFPEERIETSIGMIIRELVDSIKGNEDIYFGEDDLVCDVWKVTQCLSYTVSSLFFFGPLIITPAARPLIQLAIELNDVLFGRRDGSLLQARHAVQKAKVAAGNQSAEMANLPAIANGVHLKPFHRLLRSMAASSVHLDDSDDRDWLHACSQALDATIKYLTHRGIKGIAIDPLKQLSKNIQIELNGKRCNLFENHTQDWYHGPELSPSKSPRLHREYFANLLIIARDQFRISRNEKQLEEDWLDKELQCLRLKDESGNTVTTKTINRFDKRQKDQPKKRLGSKFYIFQQAISYCYRSWTKRVGLFKEPSLHPSDQVVSKEYEVNGKILEAEEPPPKLAIRLNLHAALLHQPRQRSVRRRVRAAKGSEATEVSGG